LSEQVARRHGATLARINPVESHGPRGAIALPLGALAALTALDHIIARNDV